MVGTTDHDFSGDPGKVEASAEEIGYLCKIATDHFRTPVFPADVVWSFAGVRPLYGDDDDKPTRSRRTRRATTCWSSTGSPARRRC